MRDLHRFVIPTRCALASVPPGSAQSTAPNANLMQDVLVGADLWSPVPEILSASYGFEGIFGVPNLEPIVRGAGGTWIDMPPEQAARATNRAFTSAFPILGMLPTFGTAAVGVDGMPIVFSWPVLPSTAQPTDFRVHLNDGRVVMPDGVSIAPCIELNERNVLVLVGELGNRRVAGEPGAVYPVRVEVVDDGTPLMLVGPGGRPRSAVGLSKESSNPYEQGNGPRLVGAKLTRMSTLGEGTPPGIRRPANDGTTLYGDDAQFRLRVLTTGGFSPNGVSAVTPDAFARFFRLHVRVGNSTVLVTQTGVDYELPMGRIRVVGLADLGAAQGPYDLAYLEDYDNYIDIVLAGDAVAMRRIEAVEIPAGGAYQRFYNPGGPGNDPTPGVRYTQPGPRDLEPVLVELGNPRVVSFGAD